MTEKSQASGWTHERARHVVRVLYAVLLVLLINLASNVAGRFFDLESRYELRRAVATTGERHQHVLQLLEEDRRITLHRIQTLNDRIDALERKMKGKR